MNTHERIAAGRAVARPTSLAFRYTCPDCPRGGLQAIGWLYLLWGDVIA